MVMSKRMRTTGSRSSTFVSAVILTAVLVSAVVPYCFPPLLLPSQAFTPTAVQTTTTTTRQQQHSSSRIIASGTSTTGLLAQQGGEYDRGNSHPSKDTQGASASTVLITKALQSAALGLAIGLTALTQFPAAAPASDPGAIVGCLFQKCQIPLAKCILNPKCLANVACINTCNGRPDEIDCQIQCGDLFENSVVGEFNKCAVSDMRCVPRQPDDGSYPVPTIDKVVPKFDTKLFEGRWYITAGQNPLFDIFPCQVHFFSATGPGKFVGKLNWRVEEPDGEFFTRDALQAFRQDPDNPAHLINHDNEYLHYEDDWYVIDYESDNNPSKTPPFAFIYYRGSNDAWDGYGGAVVYTRAAALPESLLPRLRVAAQKVGFDFDKDFTVTDNSCPTELTEGEKVILREKFAGKVLLQTEKQLQAQAVRVRGNAANSVKAQSLYFENELESTQEAFKRLEDKTREFEKEAGQVVKEAEDIVAKEEQVIEEAMRGGGGGGGSRGGSTTTK